MPAFTSLDQICNNLAHDRTELEPVTRAGRHDPHRRKFRMPVNQEMFIGGVGVQAGRSAEARPVERRNSPSEVAAHNGDFFVSHFSVNGIRCAGGIFSAVMKRNFDAAHRAVNRRHAIRMRAIFCFPNPDGKFFRKKRFNAATRLKPELHLPFHAQWQRQVRQHVAQPWPGANNELSGFVISARRCDAHRAA